MRPAWKLKPDDTQQPAPGEMQRTRIGLLLLGLVLLFGAVSLRLVFVHLWPSAQLLDEEQIHVGFDPLVEPRGKIYDRDWNLLATQRRVPSLWANPAKLAAPDCPVTAQALARFLSGRMGVDEAETRARLESVGKDGKRQRFVWIRRWIDNLTPQQMDEITEAGGGALAFREESIRFYPQGETAAHVVGFVNRAGEASEGIERAFDLHLASVAGKQVGRVVPNQDKNESAASRVMLPSLTLEYTPAKPGEDLVLTIDSALQHALEKALDEQKEHCEASLAMGMVMEPSTGAVLAMAVRPAFDPNNYDATPAELRKNRAVLDIFEPGSSFKIVGAAAALEQGLITKDTLIDTEHGRIRVPGHVVSDTHSFPGPVPFETCFTFSSNVAMIKLGAMLGPDRFDQWVRRFGFGQRTTGKDIQFESPGMYRPRDKWSKSSMYALPFGNEIGVTMPQLLRAVAVIANGGFLVQPYLVERAVDPSGKVTYQHSAPSPSRVLSATTVQTMRYLCEKVVTEGTGKKAQIPEFSVGGKTGTSKMRRKDGPGYDDRRYTSIFEGFAPVNDPRLVAVVIMQEAKMPKHHGGYACAPVFSKVIRDALVRLQVPGDLQPVDPPGKAVLAEAKPKKAATPVPEIEAVETADEVAIEDIDESPEMMLDNLALVQPGGGALEGPELPDLKGMTKRQAQEALARLNIPWDVQGAGWVVHQEPAPGTRMSAASICLLQFGNRTALESGTEAAQNSVGTAGKQPEHGKTLGDKKSTEHKATAAKPETAANAIEDTDEPA